MIVLWLGNAGRHHIGVADGLYLFYTVLEGEPIEGGEYTAKELDGAVRRQLLAQRGKPDQVAEQDGGIPDAVGDDALALAHALDHHLRQDIEQQRLRALPFLFEVVDEFLLAVAQPLLLQGRIGARM